MRRFRTRIAAAVLLAGAVIFILVSWRDPGYARLRLMRVLRVPARIGTPLRSSSRRRRSGDRSERQRAARSVGVRSVERAGSALRRHPARRRAERRRRSSDAVVRRFAQRAHRGNSRGEPAGAGRRTHRRRRRPRLRRCAHGRLAAAVSSCSPCGSRKPARRSWSRCRRAIEQSSRCERGASAFPRSSTRCSARRGSIASRSRGSSPGPARSSMQRRSSGFSVSAASGFQRVRLGDLPAFAGDLEITNAFTGPTVRVAGGAPADRPADSRQWRADVLRLHVDDYRVVTLEPAPLRTERGTYVWEQPFAGPSRARCAVARLRAVLFGERAAARAEPARLCLRAARRRTFSGVLPRVRAGRSDVRVSRAVAGAERPVRARRSPADRARRRGGRFRRVHLRPAGCGRRISWRSRPRCARCRRRWSTYCSRPPRSGWCWRSWPPAQRI